jgi:hypothetical protein
MREHRFVVTLINKLDKSKTISHAYYAPNKFMAELKAQSAWDNIIKRNILAQNYKIKEVVYDPEEQTIA